MIGRKHILLIILTYHKTQNQMYMYTFSFGGEITRNNLNFYQNGENCNSTLNGLTIINANQHVDHYTLSVTQTQLRKSPRIQGYIFWQISWGFQW